MFLQKIFYQILHFSKLCKLHYLWYKKTFRYFLRFISLAYMFMEGFWTFIQYSYPHGLPRRLSYYSIRFKKMVSYNVEEGDNGFVSHVHVSDTYMSLSEQFTTLYLLKGATWLHFNDWVRSELLSYELKRCLTTIYYKNGTCMSKQFSQTHKPKRLFNQLVQKNICKTTKYNDTTYYFTLLVNKLV